MRKTFKIKDIEILLGVVFGIAITAIFGYAVALIITIGIIGLFASIDYIVVKRNKKNKKCKTTFESLLLELEDRNYIDKLWGSLKMNSYFLNLTVRHIVLKTPMNITAKNSVAIDIKDDIEFGYNMEIIYNKIMSGSYGNEPIADKYDWFKKHNMDWQEMLKDSYKPSAADIELFQSVINYLMEQLVWDDSLNEEDKVTILYSVKRICQMYHLQRPDNWYTWRNTTQWMDDEGILIYDKHLGGF